MMRREFGQYCVRWDAFETNVDVVGSLTTEELDILIATLIRARDEREDIFPPPLSSPEDL